MNYKKHIAIPLLTIIFGKILLKNCENIHKINLNNYILKGIIMKKFYIVKAKSCFFINRLNRRCIPNELFLAPIASGSVDF